MAYLIPSCQRLLMLVLRQGQTSFNIADSSVNGFKAPIEFYFVVIFRHFNIFCPRLVSVVAMSFKTARITLWQISKSSSFSSN